MPLRLIEMIVPQDRSDTISQLLKEQDIIDSWQHSIDQEYMVFKVLVSTGISETISDLFENRFRSLKRFRITILPVEATIPRPVEPKKDKQLSPPGKKKPVKLMRVSREELYIDISSAAALTPSFIIMVALSSIVASVGLIRSNTAVVIGAMVIAPLLGPNVALALAATLGDIDLTRKARRSAIAGLILPLIFSVILGYILHVDASIPEIASRTSIGFSDIVVALAAGAAATLAFTTGASSTLIGVMVAVALLPPLVTLGLLLGAGHYAQALGAGLLLLANMICVNLAGVLTFLLQGVRPLRWGDQEPARKATIRAIISWFILLAILIAVLLISGR